MTEIKKQPWSCPLCTLLNSATNSQCTACNTARVSYPNLNFNVIKQMDTKNIDMSLSDHTTDDEKMQAANEHKSYEGASVTIVELASIPPPKKEEKEEKKKEEESKEQKDDKEDSKTKPKTLPKTNLNKADKYFTWMFAMYILIGILTFMIIEEFTFVDSLYFRVVSLFNIGYGDIIPQTDAGKILNAIVFMVIDMGIFIYVYWRIFYLLFFDMNNKCLKNMYYLLNVISFIVGTFLLFLCGTLVFLYGEGYKFVDAFAWNFDSITSVGYGFVYPSSVSAKIFCIFYIIFGYFISLYLIVYVLYSLKGRYIDEEPVDIVIKEPKSDDEKVERAGLLD